VPAIPAKASRWRLRIARAVKSAADAVAGRLAVWLLRLIRRTDPDRISDLLAALMRRIGPWLPEHRTGRTNLAAAYPEKPPAEIEAILATVWGNVGRAAAEYAHLDRLWDYDLTRRDAGRIEIPPETSERFERLRHDGKPALIFAAHLANWELPAVAAAAHGLDAALLYRAPSIGDVAAAVQAIRATRMGLLIPTGIGAPVAAAAALERGLHVGMLVDQFSYRGIEVEFFGRRCKTNTMLARLARHYDCPIHGTRVVRLPAHRFRIELTEELVPPRDAKGAIDVAGTTQMIATVVEAWVREHPEQWLWLHRRWR
jgi:Kdo2-lipid IVA lauroyltransferase/acyltransferase